MRYRAFVTHFPSGWEGNRSLDRSQGGQEPRDRPLTSYLLMVFGALYEPAFGRDNHRST